MSIDERSEERALTECDGSQREGSRRAARPAALPGGLSKERA